MTTAISPPPAIQIVIGWKPAAAIMGLMTTVAAGMIGLGVNAVAYLDSRLNGQIESVRKEIRAVNARIDGLYRQPPAPGP